MRRILDSVICDTIPCTLLACVTGDLADTLIDKDLQIYWWVGDTVSDTTLDMNGVLRRHLFLEP